jgi:hypothetical protein
VTGTEVGPIGLVVVPASLPATFLFRKTATKKNAIDLSQSTTLIELVNSLIWHRTGFQIRPESIKIRETSRQVRTGRNPELSVVEELFVAPERDVCGAWTEEID